MATPRRAIRIANCSGSLADPGYHMHRQATAGHIDAITGDYLAELNIATYAQPMRKGEHPGWVSTCLDGLDESLSIIAEKKIKVVVNGGALNPKGLAEKVAELAKERNLNLKVAYVEGDDLYPQIQSILASKGDLRHLDASVNPLVKLAKDADNFLDDRRKNIISANAYIGARGIVMALEAGADIVIAGRVTDASPVIGLAWWWHGWSETDYDALAGTLIAGHLIECSGYVTGGNFCGQHRYPPERFIDIGFGIAEVEADGQCIITKHDALNGLVNVDTVKTQFLYEIQGTLYLNPDVVADMANISIKQEGENRVRVAGITGSPPPPTTKLAVFYNAGWQAEVYLGVNGEQAEFKRDQTRAYFEKRLKDLGRRQEFDELDFQLLGRPAPNADSQSAGTCVLRIICQAMERDTVALLLPVRSSFGMQAYHAAHFADMRTGVPKAMLAFYPHLIEQASLKQTITFVGASSQPVPSVSQTRPFPSRLNYETASPLDLASFGPTQLTPLGDVVWGRSGDKGGNINLGLFVHEDDEWEWLRSLMTCAKLVELVGKDWREGSFTIERVEFPGLRAVHFVVYGILGRGTSSTISFDTLGKAFADYIRWRHVAVPTRFLERYANNRAPRLDGEA